MIKDFLRRSIPKKSTIHGIEIKKLPLGAYLDAIESVKNIPEILLNQTFPGMSSEQIFAKLKKMDEKALSDILGNLVVQIPDQAIRFLSNLIGVPYETLRDDPEIGLNGIKDIIKEFWRVNDMSDFFQDVGKAVKVLLEQKMKSGSRT